MLFIWGFIIRLFYGGPPFVLKLTSPGEHAYVADAILPTDNFTVQLRLKLKPEEDSINKQDSKADQNKNNTFFSFWSYSNLGNVSNGKSYYHILSYGQPPAKTEDCNADELLGIYLSKESEDATKVTLLILITTNDDSEREIEFEFKIN